MDKKISVIVPVFNESRHIKNSLEIILEEVKKCSFDFELLVIDDGSTDETWMQLSEFKQRISDIKAFRLSRNFGKEAAVCAGLDLAIGDAVIVMDGDLQHPPEYISQMVKAWQEGFDVVECHKKSRGHESLHNSIGSKIFYYIINKMSGYDLSGTSDFKLLDRQVVNSWKQMQENNVFFRGMTAWMGFRRKTIDFDVQERVGGNSCFSFLKLYRLAKNAITSFTSLPLHLVTFLGGLMFILSIFLGLYTIYVKVSGNAVNGFTTVILLQLLVGSSIMLSLGIIGEYIAAIYSEVKRRPRYIIAQMLNTSNGD